MKNNKKAAMFMAIAMALTPMVSVTNTLDIYAAVNLPEDVRIEKENFDSLKQVAAQYPTNYINQVNNNEKRIQTITFKSGPISVNGKVVIDIPADIVRVMSFFDRMYIYGNDNTVQNLKFSIIGPTINGSISGSTAGHFTGSKQYEVKKKAIKVNHPNYSGYKIVVEGTGTISKMLLTTPAGLPVSYDTTAWGVLGGDKPILDVEASIDATKTLSIDGITTLEEDKFKRLYATPDGPTEARAAADYFTQKGFDPGRGMFKFSSALSNLTQDSSKPGYANYTSLWNTYKKDQSAISYYDKMYGKDFEHVICYDNWPKWMLVDPNNDNNRGTPAIKHFDAAADLAAQYTKATSIKMDGRIPTYFEVKNESTIVSEWAYHSTNPNQSWDLLAQFHNKVATRMKEVNPGVKVGGPTSAWMALDSGNFDLAKKQMKFMDDTKDTLDFYSHHFYEGADLILNDTETNYGGYLTGRLEADLDLLRNHMVLTDNVKPILISETGTLHSGPRESDYWINLKNFNSYMVKYMNRPNEFNMVVPFLLPIKWWEKESPDMLFQYDENGKLGELTPLHYYLDMWEDYEGDLIPIDSEDDKVFVHAVQDGNTIYAAVNNLNPQRVSLDLDINTGDKKISKIEQKRLYLNMGELQYENKQLNSLDNIPMSVEETSIIKITLQDKPVKDNTINRKTYYGNTMLKDTGNAAAVFTINCKPDNLESSTLRVCFGRENGFSQDMTVEINGKVFKEDLEYTNKSGRYFGYVDFEVPTDIIKNSNQIKVTIPQGGGKISTVSLINDEYANAVKPTATPVPTIKPTATPVPTIKPTATPAPTVKPTATPAPTVKPTATPTPTIKPESNTVKIEAETFKQSSDVKIIDGLQGGKKVGYINNGDYISFANVNLTNVKEFTFRAATQNLGGKIEIRLNNPQGELLGTANIGTTGGWNTFKDFKTTIKETSGDKTICLVFKGGADYLFDIDYISLYKEAPVNVEIPNGDFETGKLTPWQPLWGTGKLELCTRANAHNSNFGIKYSYIGSAKVDLTNLMPNTEYKVSCYAKVFDTTKGSIGVKNHGGPEMSKVITGNNYQKYEVTFKTGANNKTATLYIYNGEDKGIVFADDFTITKVK